MSKPIPKAGIMDIDAYVGGLHTVDGVGEVVVLASNEGPLFRDFPPMGKR